MNEILRAGKDPGTADRYLWCTPDTVSWGSLPVAATPPVLVVDSGRTVTFDTVSQEGLMEDQGRDPVAYFGRFGTAERDVLPDAVELAASDLHPVSTAKGPHIVLGPVHVRGAEPGDWLRVDFLDLTPRVPYGIISTRHGRGALPDLLPRRDDGGPMPVFSKFCTLDESGGRAVFEHNGGRSSIGVRPFMTSRLCDSCRARKSRQEFPAVSVSVSGGSRSISAIAASRARSSTSSLVAT